MFELTVSDLYRVDPADTDFDSIITKFRKINYE